MFLKVFECGIAGVVDFHRQLTLLFISGYPLVHWNTPA
jgi:hypothetical protein